MYFSSEYLSKNENRFRFRWLVFIGAALFSNSVLACKLFSHNNYCDLSYQTAVLNQHVLLAVEIAHNRTLATSTFPSTI